MSTKVPVKSILKEQKSDATIDAAKAKAEKDRHNLNIALKHAHQIQHQKDVQAQILRAIEILLEYPTGAVYTQHEAETFVRLVSIFQPSDLDDLADERRIDGRCGYVLCREEPRSTSLGPSAAWKLSANGAAYCSGTCARKAMYVKTQLSSVPAWEREPDQHPTVQVHEDDRPVGEVAVSAMASRPARHAPDEELAFERGEDAASFKPRQVMTDKIVEKRHVQYQPLSSVHTAAISHTSIEGYTPQQKAKGKGRTVLDRDSSSGDEDE